MNWTTFVAAFGVLVLLLLMQRRGQISAAKAREQLKDGALIVDLRTEVEFASRHLPGAINLPLGAIATMPPARMPGKNRALLLHCQTGRRSRAALTELRAMGYTNAFNLGSYARAAQILGRR